jgi:methionyl-tRNA formyltransferase
VARQPSARSKPSSSLVITSSSSSGQSCRPRSRGSYFARQADRARAWQYEVIQPDKIKNNLELRAQLEAIQPDAILVVAYGRIIPQWMLDLPRFGNINLHGSLLPKYRGAAPIQWAIASGEQVTGVTTMVLEAGLDTGPMLLAKSVPIGEGETAEDLFVSLSSIGAELMVQTLAGLGDGSVTPAVQDHSLATLAPILTREDGLISFSQEQRSKTTTAGAASSPGRERIRFCAAKN